MAKADFRSIQGRGEQKPITEALPVVGFNVSKRARPPHGQVALAEDGFFPAETSRQPASTALATVLNAWRAQGPSSLLYSSFSSRRLGPANMPPASPSILWSYALGKGGKSDGTTQSSPAIAEDGTVFVGSIKGILHAVEGRGDDRRGWKWITGKREKSAKWQKTIDDSDVGTPSLGAGNNLYVVSLGGLLLALNSTDGQKVWEVQLNPFSWQAAPTLSAEGMLYVCSDLRQHGKSTGTLHALDCQGRKKWEFQVEGALSGSSPALGADGTVFVGSENGHLYAVNNDGTKKWEFETHGVIHSSPNVGPDGTIYVGSNNGRLYAVNPDGKLQWAFQTGEREVRSSPAIGPDGTLYIGAGRKIFAVNPDGRLKWKFDVIEAGACGEMFGSPAIGGDGTVYFSSTNGSVVAMDQLGTQKWRHELNGEMFSSPTLGPDGMLYAVAGDRLYAFAPETSSTA